MKNILFVLILILIATGCEHKKPRRNRLGRDSVRVDTVRIVDTVRVIPDDFVILVKEEDVEVLEPMIEKYESDPSINSTIWKYIQEKYPSTKDGTWSLTEDQIMYIYRGE